MIQPQKTQKIAESRGRGRDCATIILLLRFLRFLRFN